MHVAGIHTQVKAGRALVKVVVLEEDKGRWVEARKFTIKCNPQAELSQQLLDLADDLPHRLQTLDLQAVVLRDRDKAPGNRIEQLKIDFSADGVVLAELRRQCPVVKMVRGKEIGGMCGTDKATAELSADQEFTSSYKEAGAAARAAVTLL